MRFDLPSEIVALGGYLPTFLGLVGEKRWFTRVDHLDDEQKKSPYRWKMVADYHWLEMAISFQSDVLTKEGCLLPELADGPILTALNFAATVVEVHARLSEKGQRALAGRLRDGLNAETGFAALYLELNLAQRLMQDGYSVQFADMEGLAQFDLEFARDNFAGEVECKSLSADAGRRVHRKDFYRFMEAIAPALNAHRNLRRQEVLLITIRDRLSSNTSIQAELRRAAAYMLRAGAPTALQRTTFRIERRPYAECLGPAPVEDRKAFYGACKDIFGPNIHVAGGLTEDSGCVVVMRSERGDDTSKPILEAMRKAATQFSGKRPSFIAIQEHGIEPADLMLPVLRRQIGILSYALFGHYSATHVNATYVTGFGAVVTRQGQVGSPAFAVPNPRPAFAIDPRDAGPFLVHIPDADFAAAIGAPLPAPNISFLPIESNSIGRQP